MPNLILPIWFVFSLLAMFCFIAAMFLFLRLQKKLKG